MSKRERESTMVKVQFFLDKIPTGWKLIGHVIGPDDKWHLYYWDDSQYVYEGKYAECHVLLRGSVFPPIKKVQDMVAKYIDLHIPLVKK